MNRRWSGTSRAYLPGMHIRLLTSLFPLFICACSSGPPVTNGAGQAIVVPSGWVEVASNCNFSFRAPKDLVRNDVKGIDSCVGSHKSESLTFSYDYGRYSNSLSGYNAKPNFSESNVLIDGTPAKLVACDSEAGRFVGIYVANDGRGQKLEASIFCSTKGACEDTARTILSTITWK